MRKGLSDVTRRGRFIQDDALCEDNASGEWIHVRDVATQEVED